MSIQKPQEKLYYSLSQTAEMTGVTGSIIKNWENDFSQLKPMRTRAGVRHYSEKDLDLLFLIKELLIEKKLEILETQSQIKRPSVSNSQPGSHAIQLKRLMAEIKLEVREILDLLKQ